jgi:hypothetical protein
MPGTDEDLRAARRPDASAPVAMDGRALFGALLIVDVLAFPHGMAGGFVVMMDAAKRYRTPVGIWLAVQS